MKLRRTTRQPSALAKVATALLFILAALSLSSCNIFRKDQPTLPLPLEDYLPPNWVLLPDGNGNLNELQPISIDGDPETEWMLFFFYDNVPDGANGPIGGIVYDGQQDTSLYDPQVIIPFPYQPAAFFVPYRLLPDWTPGKGQGYLGDVSVSYDQTTIGADRTTPDELVVMGYGLGSVVTRLSVFYWQGITRGYGVAHFVGSKSVSTPDRKEGQPVREVITLNRFNDRSNLCSKVVYQRQGNSPAWVASPATIVFCQGGVPTEPMYPDATVLAYMLGGPDSLIVADRQPQVKQGFDRSRLQEVLNLTYSGVATSAGVGTGAVTTETVTTVVRMDSGQDTYTWQLREIKPTAPRETAEWKIIEVQRGQ